jgi:MFS family permease
MAGMAPDTPRASTAERAFLIYWAGQSVSALGDAFALVAMPLLVLESTGSVAKMGLVSALGVLAQVLASLVAGALVDSFDRRRLMIGCDVGRALIYVAVPLLWVTRGPSLVALAVAAFAGGALGNVFQVAYVAAVPSLVGPARLNEANGKLQSTQALAYVLGPLLAGIVAAHTGAATALGLDALSFVVSVVSLLLVQLRRPPEHVPRQGPPDGRWMGPRFVWGHPVLRPLLLLMIALGLTGNIGLGAGVTDLFVYRLKHDFGLSDRAVGLCLGIAAVGAVLGAVGAARLRRRAGFGACFLGGTAVQAAGLMLIGLVPKAAATAIGALLWSGGMLVRAIPSTSLRQTLTPHALLGRVISTFWALTFGASAVGTTLVTRAAAATGARFTFLGIGVAVSLVAIAGSFTAARTRHPEAAGPSSDGERPRVGRRRPAIRPGADARR